LHSSALPKNFLYQLELLPAADFPDGLVEFGAVGELSKSDK
jgi:hypothetical protein